MEVVGTQHVVLGALLDAEKDQVTANEPFQLDLENECETLRKVMQEVVLAEMPAAGFVGDEFQDRPAALFVCDLDVVRARLRLWREQVPRVRPFYAVKACPDPTLMQVLADAGIGFDCASRAEIVAVLALGVSPDRIVFANPCKAPSHIRYAKAHGVNRYTFDNESELRKLASVHPDAQVIMRLLVDDSHSVMPFGSKFGVAPTDMPELVELCAALSVDLVGFSFHVGSGCLSPDAYVAAMQRARDAMDLARKSGFSPTLVDIGGGFCDDSFVTISDGVRAGCALFDDAVDIIAEPGRFFCTSAFALGVSINSVRQRQRQAHQKQNTISTATSSPATATSSDRMDDESTERLYYVTDGVYGAFNNIIFDHARPVPMPLFPKGGKVAASCLFGPTCDSIDVIAKDVYLEQLQVGDWFFFRSMGAYTMAAASAFNGMERPHIVYHSATLPRPRV